MYKKDNLNNTVLTGNFALECGAPSEDLIELIKFIGTSVGLWSHQCMFIGFEELSEKEKIELHKDFIDAGIRVEMYKDYTVSHITNQKDLEEAFKNWGYSAGGAGLFIFVSGDGPTNHLIENALAYTKTGVMSLGLHFICQDISDGDLNAFELRTRN